MRNKKARRIVAVTLLLVLSCSLATPAHAATGYASKGSPTSGAYCHINTSTRVAVVKPFFLSQAEHREGFPTTIGVNYNVSVGCEASSSYEVKVGAEYAGLSAEAGRTAGVAVNASFSIGPSVSYSIGAEKPDGRYRIEAVFPCDYVSILVGTYSPAGNRIVVDTSISSMPRFEDVYHRLTRYADAVNDQ